MPWQSIIEAFGIVMVPRTERKPEREPLHTHVDSVFRRNYEANGAEHFTLVCRVFAETTENNALALRAHVFGAVSDVILARGDGDLDLLEKFDRIDLSEIDRVVSLWKHIPRRQAASALIELVLLQQAEAPLSALARAEVTASRLGAEVDRRGIARTNRYSGLGIASKVLGMTEDDAIDIAGLTDEAKAEASVLRLRNDRAALLRAAKGVTAAQQVAALRTAADHRNRFYLRRQVEGPVRLVA